jgi:glycosyltransferase involved in cell wall biosynthesis
MQDEGLRKRLGEAGRKRVVENFDYRTVAQKFIDIATKHLELT